MMPSMSRDYRLASVFLMRDDDAAVLFLSHFEQDIACRRRRAVSSEILCFEFLDARPENRVFFIS